MDNITHSLAGMMLAEVVCTLASRRDPELPGRLRPAAYLAAVVGNNLPDLDFGYTFITGGNLGYLMHHRGHTHTLLVGVLLGALAWAGMARYWKPRFAPGERRLLSGLLLSGPLLHLSMDYSNVYGVHPFWPLYDGWIFGDRIFIVEPFFWIACVPPIFFAIRAKWGRIALGLLIGLTLGLPWATGFVPLWLKPVISASMLGSMLVAWKCRPALRVLLGVVGSVLVLGLFVFAGSLAKRESRSLYATHFPAETLVDAALWPMPGNPACWAGVFVSRGPGPSLVLRRGMMAPLFDMNAAERCPSYRLPTSAPLVEVTAASDRRVSWGKQWSVPVAELSRLAKRCDFATYLRFARAPFWLESDGGLVVGDLRFDRTEGIDFAEVELPEKLGACPKFVPSWRPPRQEFLD